MNTKPTLALCMIVRDEEHNLPKLFECINDDFDKYVIVDTGSTDNTIKIIEEYVGQAYHFKWIDNFSAARNHALQHVKTDFWMWLDADDILTEQHKNNLLKLKQELDNWDIIISPYEYHKSLDCPRERILRTSLGLKWQGAIHEQVPIPCHLRVRRLNSGNTIGPKHTRTLEDIQKDQGRNIKILEKEVRKDRTSKNLYYYAQELKDQGNPQAAIKNYNEYLKNPDVLEVSAIINLAFCHYTLKNYEEVINTCLKGIKTGHNCFAEFPCIIGQVYYDLCKWQEAQHWFLTATYIKKPQTDCMVYNDYYTWIPWDRLAKCYSELRLWKEAYEANKQALVYNQEKRLIDNDNFMKNLLYPSRTKDSPIRVSIGSGGKPTPSYINSDLNPGENVDEVYDMARLPYDDNTVHAIHNEHCLEHLTQDQAKQAVAEWSRVLRYGGHLKLELPDLENCCQKFLEDPNNRDWYTKTIYGACRFNGDAHQYGYTDDTMNVLLTTSGFEVKSFCTSNKYGTPSLEFEAINIKPKIKVGWVMPGPVDLNNGSLRIRRINIHNQLVKTGVDSQLVSKDFNILKNQDVVIFISVFEPSDKELMIRLRACGVKVVVDHNEDVLGLEPYLQLADLVITCSTALSEKLIDLYPVKTIGDAYETTNN